MTNILSARKPTELFRWEVAEAFSAKIAKLETEDQQAVVTELRTHEQGLVAAG